MWFGGQALAQHAQGPGSTPRSKLAPMLGFPHWDSLAFHLAHYSASSL